jgi:hypothetical protein
MATPRCSSNGAGGVAAGFELIVLATLSLLVAVARVMCKKPAAVAAEDDGATISDDGGFGGVFGGVLTAVAEPASHISMHPHWGHHHAHAHAYPHYSHLSEPTAT